jgi:dienelactone hydrolase
MTRDADMQTALDWAVKENAKASSPYHNKLDPEKIALMGQSCGGLQAIANSTDPRIKTTIVWNSGLFPDGSIGTSLSAATKATLSKMHAPVAYINGGPADAAYVNALDDMKHIEAPLFFG